MLSFIGMILLIMSFDLIMIYLSIELQSLCFYILAAINRDQNKSIEAGLKYFVLGSFSSSILILGISIIYGTTGLTNLKDLSDLLTLGNDIFFLNYFFYIGLILINIGFFFKLAIAPFHI
jgi:NADH-quinone oxidoreductase subunit N